MEQVNYDEILRKFKEAQEKLHYTNKQIETLTDTSSGTFSRYLNEKTPTKSGTESHQKQKNTTGSGNEWNR